MTLSATIILPSICPAFITCLYLLLSSLLSLIFYDTICYYNPSFQLSSLHYLSISSSVCPPFSAILKYYLLLQSCQLSSLHCLSLPISIFSCLPSFLCYFKILSATTILPTVQPSSPISIFSFLPSFVCFK
jgi:hypothetical protein